MKSCQYKSSDELPLILNVQEVSNFLGLGLSQVYELVKRIDFPAFKVGSRMVDSDYQVKEEVRKARDRYIEMGAAAGFEMAPITWTQKQKGVDDLYKHLFRDK